MEKRVLIAVVLSFLVLYGYQTYFVKPVPPGARRAAAGQQVPGKAAVPGAVPGAGSGAAGAAAPATLAPGGASGPAPAQPLVSDQAEREVVVETSTVRAVFTNRGARLKSWRLKSYLDLEKHPQELVPSGMPEGTTLPFELRVDDEAATSALRVALFRPSVEGAVDATREERTVAFEYKDSSGLSARKEFVFSPKSFVVRVTARVSVRDEALNPTILWGPGPGDVLSNSQSSRYTQKAEGIVFRGEKVQRLGVKDITAQPVQEGDLNVAGVDDLYFVSMALPRKPVRAEYQQVVVPAPPGQDAKNARDYVAYGVRQRESAEDVRFFFGPKDFDVLEAVDRRLVRAINFGMFDWLAVPLLRALKWINASVGNYGWSIIILTVLINLVMFPLRHKSVVSMRKMQEIQPQIKAIQEKYSKLKMGDPERQKQNTEMMSLYRDKGVNPASGCIPMLLTFPVLFAFYSLLSQAIEIRGADFALWIRDLSAHDPLYVTPILMGITMVWQQRLTPSGADPVQQKMMMAMPLVFTFMFLWAPSGLVLYWFVSNVLAIGQQYVTNAMIGPSKAPRPPAERKLKRAAQ
jgi:YidC/Oxa1 family membrane protein insertase